MNYELWAQKECMDWQHEMMKRSSMFGRTAKSIQQKINNKIPQKVHDVLTESIKGMVHTVLFGSDLTTKRQPAEDMTFEARESLVKEKIKTYKRLAAIEGAGTGFGGLLWGLADFPMLLSIKIKFLFDTASIYGFDVKDYRERLYILHVFQVAFSSEQKRIDTLLKLKNWEETVKTFPSLKNLDWQAFQQEYRDYIDLAKLLQLIPGFGAIVGAIANNRFLDHLGITAMNAYRMRLLKDLE
ncbi:EcsC family protein [Scopulibacillus darangshiensis]|uniref:EcsC family protein n=1 Tax=Scopulibacillus darangshiensis TaxID=442528 RepID=A0A4R2P8S8_9BACL|nr:EcsC family protein [Scopulibacillus darangshiensis]TCP31292.1 EcsC family protein [Scopulibacillus darangshiensis]